MPQMRVYVAVER